MKKANRVTKESCTATADHLNFPPQPVAQWHKSRRGKAPKEDQANGLRILLVDDDDILRELVAEALLMSGYQVACAADGEAGWELLCKMDFDLLITDHNMPRLSGFDLINRMRHKFPEIRTIMITGYMPFQFPASVNSVPFCQILAKPFSLKELLKRVGNSLELLEEA